MLFHIFRTPFILTVLLVCLVEILVVEFRSKKLFPTPYVYVQEHFNIPYAFGSAALQIMFNMGQIMYVLYFPIIFPIMYEYANVKLKSFVHRRHLLTSKPTLTINYYSRKLVLFNIVFKYIFLYFKQLTCVDGTIMEYISIPLSL